MSAPNTLAGFDLVFAVTQQTINHQLATLSAFEVLPSTWQVSLNSKDPTKPPKLDAVLGIPYVDLVSVGDASGRMVLIHFPIVSGTLSYFEFDYTNTDDEGKPTSILKNDSIDGWDLSFKVNLDLAGLEQRLIADHKAIPPEVKQQLTAFDESMFDISHLFLNFENANLVDTFDVKGADTSALNAPEVVKQFKSMLDVLLKKLKGSDNPFILGYTVTNKPPANPNAPKPTFEPTGTNYSTYPEPSNPAISTLNYLLMTQNRPVLGRGYGIFTHNWVNTDTVQGSFVISQPLIMNQVLPTIAASLGADASQFSQSGNGFSLTVDNSYGSNTTCTVTPIPGTNQIAANFVLNVRQDIHDSSIFHSYIGYIDGYATFNSLLTFNLDATNNLNVNVLNSALDSSQLETHKNGLGDFESGLATAADAIRTAFKADAIYQNMIHHDWNLSVGAALPSAISNARQRIILPAGGVFFFKDPVFSSEGHLMLTTTYKN
jgi:hypothetical protein